MLLEDVSTRKLRKKFTAIGLMFFLFITSTLCFTIFGNEPEENLKVPEDYISFVSSEFVGEQIITSVMYFDSDKGFCEKVLEFESIGYSLGIYQKSTERVYYTKNIDGAEQIFLFDLATNEEKQLTDSLFAINYIFPVEDKVYFAARSYGGVTMRLGVVDIITNKIQYWLEDEDTSVEYFTVDLNLGKIFVSTFSEKELRHSISRPDNEEFVMPTYSVFETNLDFLETKKLFGDEMWVRTVMTNAGEVIGLAEKMYVSPDESSVLYLYNLSSGGLVKNGWTFEKLRGQGANFSSDGKYIYSLMSHKDKHGLFSFNVETMKLTPVYVPDNEFISTINVFK